MCDLNAKNTHDVLGQRANKANKYIFFSLEQKETYWVMSVNAKRLRWTLKKSKNKVRLCCILEKHWPCLLALLTCSETDIVPWWQCDVLKWRRFCRTIWSPVGHVSGAIALRLSKAQMKVSRAPARLSFYSLLPLLRLSLSLCPSVSLPLSIYLVSCAQGWFWQIH